MSASAPGISLEQASKWYGEVMGLNDVSAEFGVGVTGLLGPNGAGKSTMIKMICGMLEPSLGTVEVCGEAPFNNPGVMRRVGLVPEQDAAYPEAAAWDVVAYLTRLHGFTALEARDRARRTLERVGLGHVLKKSIATFSKGMKQRAKLAQALAHDPDVLVLDEPLNGLDPTGRREYSALIRALGDKGCCVLVSSHILHEVDALARRLLVLSGGRVLADGTAREIREDLSEYPLTVQIQTSNVAVVAARLVTLDGVERVERIVGGVEVLTRIPNTLFDAVAAFAAEEGLDVQGVRPMDEDLEAVFRYLTE